MQTESDKPHCISNLLQDSELLLRSMIENLPGGAAFVVDSDLRYRLAEGEALSAAGFQPEDLVGRTIFEVLPSELAASYEPQYRKALAGEPFEVEHQAHNRFYISRGTPLRSGNGEVYGVLAVSYDITESKLAEAQLRHAAQMDAFRVKLSDTLRSLTDPVQIQAEACRLLGEHLGVDRAYYVEVHEPEGYARVNQHYSRGDSPSIVGEYPLAEYGWSMQLMRRGETIVVADTQSSNLVPDAERAAMAMLQMVGFVALPLIKGEVLVGALTLNEPTPREWTEAEVDLVRETAERIWADIQRAHAEIALHESEQKYRTLFDSIDEGLAIVEMIYDDQGEIVDIIYRQVNRAYERHGGVYNVVGRSIFDIIPGVEDYWLDLYKRVARTGESVREENYQQDVDRWFDVYFSRVDDNGRFVAIVFSDISDRKNRELNVAFLDEIGKELSRLSAPDEIIQTVGARVGEFLGLSGCYFVDVDEAKNEVTVHYGRGSEKLPSLMQTFKLEDYLTEDFIHTMRAQEVFLMRDTAQDERAEAENYARLKVASFVTVPFLRNGRYTGHIAVTSEKPRDWQPQEIELLQEIASRIFPRIERARAEEALRESEEALAADLANEELLRELAVRLIIEENVTTIYDEILSATIAIARADAGTIQIYDLQTQSLELIASKNFSRTITDYFYQVDASSRTACGIALNTGQRAFVDFPDEVADFGCQLLINEGIQAALALPLVSRTGTPLGMLNAHWRETRYRPSDRELRFLDLLARQVADLIEQRQAEAALRESEAKYRSLFDSIDAGFCIFEMVYNEAGEAIDFRYIETNPAFERQSGRRPQPGQTMRELFPEAEDMWLKDYAEVARTGQAKRFIDFHQELDRWFDVFVFPTSNGKNQLAALFSDVTEEKRSEAALRESEERLQKAISIETVGVLFFTLDGQMTDANDTFLRMSGYSRNELRNLTDWQELTPPEFWDVTSGAALELATQGNTAPYEKQHIRKDGSRWWGLFAPTRLKGSGRSAECVEFVIDISDRKQAEAQLSRAAQMDAFRAKLADALRSLTDPVEIQSEAARAIGEHLGAGRAAYAEIEADGAHFTIHRDYTNGVPSFAGHYPNDSYGAAFFADLRAGRSVAVADAERNARLSEADRVAFAAGMVRAAVAVPLNKGGRLAAIFFLHFPVPHEWPADEVALVEETAERTWAAVERARSEAALRESEFQRVREQSAREQERQRAESLAQLDRAKTLFFSNISHEFRTPLTLSLAPLQDALSDCAHPLDPIHRERLELVHRNNLRLLKLVNTLLDFSRIEAGRMEAVYEPTDLATYTAELSSVFRSAIERAGLQLIVDCPPLPEPVFVDREMWEKIVLNLLSNAFKFTFEGEITVSLRSTNSNQAVLQIQDTGTGIAPEHLPHLFERFYQVRSTQARTHEGSGIGLALVHELVQLHGGTIDVRSTVGQGTCFAIALPFGTEHLPNVRVASPKETLRERNQPTRTLTSTAMGATAYVAEAERWLPTIPPQPPLERGDNLVTVPLNKGDLGGSSESKTDSASSARVLLIDDNADMREYLTHILSEYVQIEAVADGATALAIAQERVPDLILSDVMMPGLDGFELLEALRADPRTKEIPIILLSARAGEDAIVEGLQAGADDYLIKPFSAQELVSRVTTHLQMSHIRGEALQKARSTIRNRDEFISVVSHELNTPLVSILGWTRILQSNPPSPAMLIKALDIIEYNAMLQAKLVQDLLDISRISAGKLRLNLEPVELEGVIEKAIATVHNLAQAKQINLMWYGDTSKVKNVALVVMGDRERLSQVVCNLLTNAIKFTPKLGSVTVELSAIEDNNFPEDSCTQITVRDTGIGIAADFLPHVFDRFRQARESDAAKGLGLGLAIARHIVELHHGTIHAESAGVGSGATFIVRLPLYKPNE